MRTVSEREFNDFVAEHNAVPDGFRPNGGFVQTRWYANGREVGRRSQDSQGTIYEIIEVTHA